MSNHSLAVLTAAFNSIPGVKPVKRFPSKGAALDRIVAAGYAVDASGAVAPLGGPAPFQKATKETLAAMDGAARAAYRLARRAAARSARRAKRAALAG
jgi:hypothetical protein